ncbi:MAG: family 10 glycosylhydrolase [Muribaculaceae bacterium]|nr:family 10 glycosylhydrolase [Muribaculaceae bacterium]
MNRNSIRKMMAIVALTVALVTQAAQFGVPKREFRSAWVATVWALDWPQTTGADAYTAQRQQEQLMRMLDSLQNHHFNAVNFQVRSMCDAMYQSSYEPWSSYLTGTRGKAPTYDPLAFVVAECHKRGMECHAWVNPYRFTTSTDWNTEQDQELKNDGWLIRSGDTKILDPGQQRTIDRIVNVCKEIIENYDVDGVLYDDYFYPSGITSDSSADDYQEWVDSGTTMSLGDWRRDNVNRMVRAVYDMIQQTRPEVRFGISPAGVAASSSSVAAKYGVDPCPGSDWQYSGIFSDPLAWYADKSIDYMSPQVYWHIGRAGADYGLIVPWWNKVAKKFGRHMFVSHSISELNSKSKGSENPEPGMTYLSDYIYDEFANEVELMRTTNEDGAMGSIFYSCKYLYRMGAPECLGQFLLRTTYTRPALPPAMPWKQPYNPGQVRDLSLTDGTLTWTGYDDVRYTIYAFPETMAHDTFARDGEYLLGFCYDTQFTLPEHYRSGYHYAVCVLDRVGNEYDPVILGEEYDPLPAPALTYPDDGAELFAPFNLQWNAVEGAESYVVEVATQASFDQVLARVTTSETSLSTQEIDLESGVKHYWRVMASGPQHTNGISATRTFTPLLLLITEPANGTKLLELPLTVRWNTPAEDAASAATLTIASDEEMSDVVFTGQSATGQLTLEEGALVPGTRYYATVALDYEGMSLVSPVVTFTTQFATPSFVRPTDGGILYGDEYITVQLQSEAVSYTVEVSASATSWGRTRFLQTISEGDHCSTIASQMKVGGKLLEDGVTYYARLRMNYLNENNASTYSDYSPVISFTYCAERPVTISGDVNGDDKVDVEDVNQVINIILDMVTSDELRATSDVNGDGKVYVEDVNIIINIILKVN